MTEIWHENIIANLNRSCFSFLVKEEVYEECSRWWYYSNILVCWVYLWALCLFAVFVLRCGRSADRVFDPGMVHRDHVCRGAPHPCRTHSLLCAEKQRWQVCRYAAAPATRHVLHGKRSVSLWPGLGPLHILLWEVNQNLACEMYGTCWSYQSDFVIFTWAISDTIGFSGWYFYLTLNCILVDLLKECKCWVGLNPDPNPDPNPAWKCIMHACQTAMHANPAKPKTINNKWTVHDILKAGVFLLACEIIFLAPLGLFGNCDHSPCQAIWGLALFQSLPPLTCADCPGSSSVPLCCLVSEPNSVSQWSYKVPPHLISSL